jgi:hypothetical protein
MNKEEIYQKAIEVFGIPMQLIMAIEEMSELTKEIIKDLRGKRNFAHISEEIADIEIMLEQLKIIYKNADDVNIYKHDKLYRLMNTLEKERGDN